MRKCVIALRKWKLTGFCSRSFLSLGGRHASFRGVIPGAADLCNAGILGPVQK